MYIAGAGPAGSTAAIAAALAGAEVTLYDKSRFPRHKVCGEFLSPEMFSPLEKLGVLRAIEAAHPARIERLRLRFPTYEKTGRLPDIALGLSRFTFDHILLEHALDKGAVLKREIAPRFPRPMVLATGRKGDGAPARGERLFGFKAHFAGPPGDAIELFFWGDAYVGINSIEDGSTNVCGIATEHILQNFGGFDYDAMIASFQPLRERLSPLARKMDWLTTGPLVFGNSLRDQPEERVYPAGDALSFVDPFTGSGLASALITGRLAGRCAAAGTPVDEYLGLCKKAIAVPFTAAAVFRAALRTRLAEAAVAVLPSEWLVRMTRPHAAI